MPLHVDYRPKTLQELIGNKVIKDVLTPIFARSSDYPHAYLLHGPRGCGKTTIGRIIAWALGCDELEFHEYDMATFRGIDTARDIRESCAYAPMVGKIRFYLFDEVHRQTVDAQNAILKLLEEPPEHAYFALATTEPEKLLATIRSRCMQLMVAPLIPMQTKKLIKTVLKAENVENFPDRVIEEIIRVSEGVPREALVMLDSVIDIKDEESAVQAISTIKIDAYVVKDLCNALVRGVSWTQTREMLKVLLVDHEPERIRHAILGYFAAVLMNKPKGKEADVISEAMLIFTESTFYTGKPALVNMVYAASRS